MIPHDHLLPRVLLYLQELEELLEEVHANCSDELDWTKFKAIARKLHLVRVPETSLLAAVIMLEIGLWCLVLVTFAPYHYFCVGPAELWDRTDGFLGYLFAFLMEGVHHPAIRRQMYFYSAMVYLIGGGPYLLFKVHSTLHFPIPLPCATTDYSTTSLDLLYTTKSLTHVHAPRMHRLFQLPLIGPSLFGLRRASGYDRQGNVRVMMTAEESEHRYKHEQRAVSNKCPK